MSREPPLPWAWSPFSKATSSSASQLLAGLGLARSSGAEEWIGQASFSMGVVEQDRGRPDLAGPILPPLASRFW